MRTNKFIDFEFGTAIKKFCLYLGIFVITFGVGMSIKNAGGTYAADYAVDDYRCESSDYWVAGSGTNGKVYCCPTNYSLTLNGGEACYGSPTSGTTCSYGEYQSDNTSAWYGKCLTTFELAVSAYQTVNYDANGGSISPSSVTAKYGDTITLPTPDKWQGHTFLYWTVDGSDTIYNAGSTLTIYRDWNFVAAWKQNSYTLSYDLDGGTLNGKTGTITETYLYGDEYTLLDGPSKSGYTFLYWVDNNSETVYNPGDKLNIYTNRTFTASYKLNSGGNTGGSGSGGTTSYSVYFGSLTDHNATFYKNNIATTNYTQTVTTNSINLDEYTASSDNYNFLGWSYGDCDSLKSGVINLENSETKIYACWSSKSSGGNTDSEPTAYTVTFNVNGATLYKNGKKLTTTSVTSTKLNYADYTAEKDGYLFKGWSSVRSCTSVKTTGTLTVTKNTTLYACFDVDETNVDENPNTGSFLLYVVYFIGILAFVYTGYYSYKYIKLKK